MMNEIMGSYEHNYQLNAYRALYILEHTLIECDNTNTPIKYKP